jgi:hypothetical protein
MKSDAATYAPSGRLTKREETWVGRLRGRGAILKWRVVGRDGDGCLVAETTLGCGRSAPTGSRLCTVTLTPAGHVHQTTRSI